MQLRLSYACAAHNARCLLSVCLGVFLSIKVCAQNTETTRPDTLNQTTISAERIPSATLQSAPTQVIDRSSLDRLGIQELHEAVKTFSGVQVKDYGGIGGIKTVSVRGLGTQHTGIIYDGVSVSNAANGQIDIGQFSLENVSNITLSIAGSDDIFRSARTFSTAGALIIKSTAPYFEEGNRTHLSVSMKTSTYDFSRISSYGWNPSISWKQKLSRRWSLTADADWLRSEGEYPFTLTNASTVTRELRQNTDVNTLRSEINLYGIFKTGGTLAVKGSGLLSERGLPGNVILYNTDSNERLWDRNAFLQTRYEKDFNEKWSLQGQLKYQYSYNRYHDENEYYEGGQINDEYSQREYYGSVSTCFRPSERWSISIAEDAFINTLWETIPDAAQPRRFTNMSALSGQYKSPRLTVTASTLATYITEEVCASTTQNAAPDRFRLSPALSLSWRILKEHNLRLRAAYQDIYRTPTFNDLYYARVGNKDLRPEIARQFNLGLTWNEGVTDGVWDRLSVSLDGYYNKVQDKIVARPTMFIWKMRNIGEVNILGCDVNLATTFSLPQAMSLELTAAYTYQYAVDVTDPDSKTYKNQIPYTPRHSGNASLSWMNRWVNVSYMLTGVSERWSMDQNTDGNRLAPYLEHSVSLFRDFGFKASDLKLRITAECRNITDEQYEIIQYYPMPGRCFRLNLKLYF